MHIKNPESSKSRPSPSSAAYHYELQAKVDALRRLQAETGAELDALLPAVLDRAFKGEF